MPLKFNTIPRILCVLECFDVMPYYYYFGYSCCLDIFVIDVITEYLE